MLLPFVLGVVLSATPATITVSSLNVNANLGTNTTTQHFLLLHCLLLAATIVRVSTNPAVDTNSNHRIQIL